MDFVRFTDVMKRIKDFMKEVFQLQSYKKFYKFNDLVGDFETVMKVLNFINKEQRKIETSSY